jgi:hypothetical protein
VLCPAGDRGDNPFVRLAVVGVDRFGTEDDDANVVRAGATTAAGTLPLGPTVVHTPLVVAEEITGYEMEWNQWTCRRRYNINLLGLSFRVPS